MSKITIIIASLILVCFFQPADSKKKDYVCVQMDTCQCMFQSGLGINLNGLNVSSLGANNETVVFHPCINIAIDEPISDNVTYVNECEAGTSLCLMRISVEMRNLGPADSFNFQTNIDGTEIQFVSNYNSWTTTIKLRCEPYATNDQLVITDLDTTNQKLNMLLKSPKSCKTYEFESVRLGGWSVLYIVIFTFLLVYFVGGAFFRKFLFGVQGREMIPHYSFWNSVPSRLLNCISSCATCCHTPRGYDRI